MKRSRFLSALCCGLFLAATALGAEKTPIIKQTNAIVEKINLKLKSGANSLAQFQPELAEFDALIAAHRAEKTEEVAGAVMMKATFHLEVFQDFGEARKLLTLLKTDFPKTEVASHANEILASLDMQEKALKIQASLVPGTVFPDFQETDTNGKAMSISALKGKVVFVDFWATWCPPCIQEMPNVLAVYTKYHSAGFEVVSVSLDVEKAPLASFTTKNKLPWPQYFDGKRFDNKLAEKYGITAIPQSYLLDRKGVILNVGLRGEELAQAVQKAVESR